MCVCMCACVYTCIDDVDPVLVISLTPYRVLARTHTRMHIPSFVHAAMALLGAGGGDIYYVAPEQRQGLEHLVQVPLCA